MAAKRTRGESFLHHLEPLQGGLEAYCRRMLRDVSFVPDVLQSAIANAFRDFHLYAEGTNFRAWIFRYVHLEILNCNRKRVRTRYEELSADLSIEETWDLALDEPLFRILLDAPDRVLDSCDDEVAEAVRDLNITERSVLLLQAVGEFKYREIAEILQIPIGTVMSSLARCRFRLRQRLVEYAEDRGLLRLEEK